MIDQDVIEGRTGTFYVSFAPLQLGIASLDDTEDYRSLLEPNATFSYSVRSSTVGCYWFNEETSLMSSEGCTVSSNQEVPYYCIWHELRQYIIIMLTQKILKSV